MRKLAALLALCLSSLAAPANAQDAAGANPLFASSDVVHLTMQASFSALARNRQQKIAVAGTLVDPSGQVLPVSLRLRGITRRLSATCAFPPVRVDFQSPPPPGSLFAGQKKLKLVTHCRQPESFQQYLLLEYAAYRMFNALTPQSFRVRLATIDYKEADGRPIASRAAFFIEDLGDVARRNNLPLTHAPDRVPLDSLNATAAARYALFQHMIANHDWSMRAGPAGQDCCHNAELIGPLSSGGVVVIPYDFDFSGLVSAPYASPPDELQLSSVRDRQYRGYCAHNGEALAVARQMRDAQPQMLAALASTPGLDPRTIARAQAFLAPFFADIGSDELVAARVFRRCAN